MLCGLPRAADLTKLVFDTAYGWTKHTDYGADTRDSYLGFIRHLYPACDLKDTWPDFEDLITVLDEWTQWKQQYEGHEDSEAAPSASHLKFTLLKSLEQFVCERVTNANVAGLHTIEQFVRWCAEAGDTIVSFNWDTLIEVACANQGIEVDYKDGATKALHISKPHGSVHLAEMTLDEYNEALKSINVHDLDTEWTSENQIVVRARVARDAWLRVAAPFKKTMLVEPSARKVYRSTWINNQWARAYRMMRAADRVVVIGFSMPNADYRPRVLFQVTTLHRNPLPKVILVGPSANELATRYREVVSAKVEHIAKPWRDWFEAHASSPE